MTAEEVVESVHGREVPYRLLMESRHYAAGYHKSIFRRSGLRFARIGEWEEVKDARRINRRASLRTRKIAVNIFEEDKHANLVYVGDCSRSKYFGHPTKQVRSARLAAALTYTARKIRDLSTLITFAEIADRIFYRQLGKDVPLRSAEALLENSFSGIGSAGIEEAVELLPRTPSLVFIASDFLPPANEKEVFFDAISSIVALRHEVVPLIFRDLWETELPSEDVILIVKDSETGQPCLLQTGGAIPSTEHDQELREFFDDLDIEPVWLYHGEDDIETLSDHFQDI